MSALMFLTHAEIFDLTGRKQKAAQRKWLARNGVRFYVRADGAPAVLRDVVTNGGSADSRRASGFNLAALDGLE
jgi:hypothetical protein